MIRRSLPYIAAGTFALSGCSEMQSALAPAGDEARRVALLTWILFAGAAMILLIVGIALYLGIRGSERSRRLLGSDKAIKLGGIAFPVVTLTVLLGYGVWLMRGTLATDQPGTLRIEVTGEQWWWRVAYAHFCRKCCIGVTGPDDLGGALPYRLHFGVAFLSGRHRALAWICHRRRNRHRSRGACRPRPQREAAYAHRGGGRLPRASRIDAGWPVSRCDPACDHSRPRAAGLPIGTGVLDHVRGLDIAGQRRPTRQMPSRLQVNHPAAGAISRSGLSDDGIFIRHWTARCSWRLEREPSHRRLVPRM